MNRLRERTTATLLIAIFMISAFAIVIPVSAALPTIDGVIGSGEWAGAVEILVSSSMGTVKVLATTDYLYVLFDVIDPTDNRVDPAGRGNDKIGLNINPGGGAWGKPYDIVFQTGTDHTAFTTPEPDVPGSSGLSDGYETEWVIDGVQLPLPGDLVTKTLYSGSIRISEWKVPLATMSLSPGDTFKLGGACDNLANTGDGFSYPPGLDWSDPASTFVEYTLPLPPTLYWFKASGGGVSISDVSPTAGNFITLGVMGISLAPASYDEEIVSCKGSGTLVDHTEKIKLSFDIETGHIKRSGRMLWFYGTAKIFDIENHVKYNNIEFRLALVDDQHDPPNRFDVVTYGDFRMHWHGTLEPGSEVTVWVWE